MDFGCIVFFCVFVEGFRFGGKKMWGGVFEDFDDYELRCLVL